MVERELVLVLAAKIVFAHVSNNTVPTDQLPALIQQVFNTLPSVEQKFLAPSKPKPAVHIRQSVRADHIVCLDCGKQFSMLKRHLMTDHKLTPEAYRQRCDLPPTHRWLHLATRRDDRLSPRRSDWVERGTRGGKWLEG
jgi:predicted transcriptional regulator